MTDDARQTSVLLIEDHRDIAEMIVEFLEGRGFAVDYAGDGVTGLHLAVTNPYDVIVLDVMLPGLDGLALCRKLREEARRDTPLLMLTARDTLDDKLRGLDAGADDYLVKPFEIDELLARVEALTRRSAYGATARLGPLEIDRIQRKALVAGAPVDLTGLEFRLLARLAQEGGRPVDRPTLLADVWDLKFDPGSGVVEVHVSRLRDKLGEHAWMVETVRGAGYRLRTERKRSEPPPRGR